MKKLLILGGSRYILPVIEEAHKLGCYVITMDYLPDNIAHKYSDEYVNVSIVNKEAVLAVAVERDIDGIMSFACDPGVVSAAYVAEKMGLPFQGSYDAVCTLQDKGLFRKFLADNNFNVPHAKRYKDALAPFSDLDYFTWPVIVKPTDSAGSKGVTRVDNREDLSSAIDRAINESFSGAFIIEDFLAFKGYHSSADSFTVDGELRFITFSDQLFDPNADNPYTPSLIVWPTTAELSEQSDLTRQIQKLMNLLDMKTGIYNIETCVGADGTCYLMEVSPRGGGCKIAELQHLAYGVNLIEAEVRSALDLPVEGVSQAECNGVWCEMVVHARPGESGVLKKITIDSEIENRYLKVCDIAAQYGDVVKPFTGANMALGDLFLRFDSREELDAVISRSDEWLHIELA